MLDNLKPLVRHFILLVISAAFTAGVVYLQTNQDTILANVPPAYAPIAGILLTVALGYFTTLTKQYGVGSTPSEGADAGAVPPPPVDPPAGP
jgi:hypothetical protein